MVIYSHIVILFGFCVDSVKIIVDSGYWGFTLCNILFKILTLNVNIYIWYITSTWNCTIYEWICSNNTIKTYLLPSFIYGLPVTTNLYTEKGNSIFVRFNGIWFYLQLYGWFEVEKHAFWLHINCKIVSTIGVFLIWQKKDRYPSLCVHL